MNPGNSAYWCEALYHRKAAPLLLYGRALGLSHAEAEDVLQETFIALMRLPEPPTQADHYCMRAFRNRVLNYRRSFWRRVAKEWYAGSWFEPSPSCDEGEREAIRRLEQLPTDQREVIVLKIWNRLSHEEIGALLGISPNTAAGRYRYGMEKLRRRMKGSIYERDGAVREANALVGAARPLSSP